MQPLMPNDPRQHAEVGRTAHGAPARTSDRRRQRSRGQSLVEFAVLLPVLVVILALVVAADYNFDPMLGMIPGLHSLTLSSRSEVIVQY